MRSLSISLKYHRYIQVENGTLYELNVEENPFRVLHVFGGAYDRGYAYGSLMADDLLSFIDVDLPQFYKSEVDQIPLDDLPEWLQDIIKDPLKFAAPEVFNLALAYVYDRQKEHIASSPANVWEETDGIVDGMCSVKKCDAEKYKKKIRHVNMLPELIRMQCSMMGAYGEATPSDEKLVQLRTLDFGTGPFANTVRLVDLQRTRTSHHSSPLHFRHFSTCHIPRKTKACLSRHSHSQVLWVS